MTLGQRPFNASRSLPTLEAINRRCGELLAYQALQQAAQSTAAKGEILAEDHAYPPEGSHPFDDQEEDQENSQELQAPYPDAHPEPSAPPPPALAVPALYGIAGRIVNSLTPHTEADPAAVLLQFLAAFAVWDYCCASACLLFDTTPIDPTAQRISQALDVTPEGLSRVQIRALFNRHVSKERIDLALEQLMTLGLINCGTSAGRGRPATLWAKVEGPKAIGPETYGA